MLLNSNPVKNAINKVLNSFLLKYLDVPITIGILNKGSLINKSLMARSKLLACVAQIAYNIKVNERTIGPHLNCLILAYFSSNFNSKSQFAEIPIAPMLINIFPIERPNNKMTKKDK